MTNRISFLSGAFVGIAVVAIGAFIALLIIVYTGSYNISAREDHSSFGRWALSTTMTASVQRQAKQDHPEFTEAMVAAGASEYQNMCEHCHGAPGKERASWADGMLPQPPYLTEAAAEWTPAQVFWLVNNGVKMSAMPAFGQTHDEKTLWNITAFVKQLPAMTNAEYQQLTGKKDHNH